MAESKPLSAFPASESLRNIGKTQLEIRSAPPTQRAGTQKAIFFPSVQNLISKLFPRNKPRRNLFKKFARLRATSTISHNLQGIGDYSPVKKFTRVRATSPEFDRLRIPSSSQASREA